MPAAIRRETWRFHLLQLLSSHDSDQKTEMPGLRGLRGPAWHAPAGEPFGRSVCRPRWHVGIEAKIAKRQTLRDCVRQTCVGPSELLLQWNGASSQSTQGHVSNPIGSISGRDREHRPEAWHPVRLELRCSWVPDGRP